MKICTEPGCERETRTGSAVLCNMHYARAYYREHYLRPPIPASERRGPISYTRAHQKVAELRGPARGLMCAAEGCTERADHWSYTPGDEWEQTGYVERVHGKGFVRWSSNPHAYEPLCITHHAQKDKEARNA